MSLLKQTVKVMGSRRNKLEESMMGEGSREGCKGRVARERVKEEDNGKRVGG